MKKICEVVKKSHGNHPQRVLQIGDGNFLRAFAAPMIENANEKGVFETSIAVCAPLSDGKIDALNAQNGLYTVISRGIEGGKTVSRTKVITSVAHALKIKDSFKDFLEIAKNPDLQIVISNTTEAGIAYQAGIKMTDNPPATFPAKMTLLLYNRYQAFRGDPQKGLIFLPCELNERNADLLKEHILHYAKDFNLEADFIDWICNANVFANTLVDQIVTGYPKSDIEALESELGYKDELLVASEIFRLWIIEDKLGIKDRFPLDKAGANILWAEDISQYKTRKVRILNGAHTSTVLAAYLAGFDFVLDFMNDDTFKRFLHKVLFDEIIPSLDMPKNTAAFSLWRKVLFDEIIPSLDMPRKELEDFAGSVLERFANPFIKHSLLDIALNSFAKFNTRCLPSILDYHAKTQTIPKLLAFSFAALIKFYYEAGSDKGRKYQARDGTAVLSFFDDLRKQGAGEKFVTAAILSNKEFWNGQDLTQIEGLSDAIAAHLMKLNVIPIKAVMKDLL